MKWDLKRPCAKCPFRRVTEQEAKDVKVIRFAERSRAVEIEESAYRNGFVCHEHSTYVEDEEGEGGFTFGEDGEQHCVGFLLMHASGGGNVPFQHLDEDEQDRIWERIEAKQYAEVWENETEFLDSYGPELDEEE